MTVCTSVKCLRMAGFCIYWTVSHSWVTVPTGPPRSPGRLLPSTWLTRSGSVCFSGYSCSRTHLCSQSCSFWHTTHVVCRHLTQGAPTNLNKSELNALYLWDPELRVGLLYTHFFFFFFCMESQCALKSVLGILLPPCNLSKKILFDL